MVSQMPVAFSARLQNISIFVMLGCTFSIFLNRGPCFEVCGAFLDPGHPWSAHVCEWAFHEILPMFHEVSIQVFYNDPW